MYFPGRNTDLKTWRQHKVKDAPGLFKNAEGCRQFCTYCIVPYARGPIFSRPPAEAVHGTELARQDFANLFSPGYAGSYGDDLDGEINICHLLRELVQVEGLERIRISSLEPTEVTAELVELMLQEKKICHHLHLPLQSGDDEILRRMNRRYTAREFLRLVSWLRSRLPDLALTTDVMVGFPTETEEQFANTVKVVRAAAFSRLHVFKYSPRQGTRRQNFPDRFRHR